MKQLQGMKWIIRYLHYVNQFNQQLGQQKNILKRKRDLLCAFYRYCIAVKRVSDIIPIFDSCPLRKQHSFLKLQQHDYKLYWKGTPNNDRTIILLSTIRWKSSRLFNITVCDKYIPVYHRISGEYSDSSCSAQGNFTSSAVQTPLS